MLGLLYQVLLGIPVTLGKQIIHAIKDEIDRQCLMTEESIKQRLQQLHLALQDGELTEAQYDELEAGLIARLKAVRAFERSEGGQANAIAGHQGRRQDTR